jgi:hypothetical protein
MNYADTNRGFDIQLERLEIVMDPNDSSRVWLYMLDNEGDRVEGGEFNAAGFMLHVLKFYNERY